MGHPFVQHKLILQLRSTCLGKTYNILKCKFHNIFEVFILKSLNFITIFLAEMSQETEFCQSQIMTASEKTINPVKLKIPDYSKKNCAHVLLVVKLLCSVIDNSHNIWVVVFVIIVKWIKEDAQTDPFVWAAKDLSIICSFRVCVPECLKQGATWSHSIKLVLFKQQGVIL